MCTGQGAGRNRLGAQSPPALSGRKEDIPMEEPRIRKKLIRPTAEQRQDEEKRRLRPIALDHIGRAAVSARGKSLPAEDGELAL